MALPCANHSAKHLPSVTLGKQHMTSTVPTNVALPSVFYRTLGKYFAESWNRHSVKKSNVTERRRSRRICQVSWTWHSANLPPLPSVNSRTLGKPGWFAECQISGTRQTCLLFISWVRPHIGLNNMNIIFLLILFYYLNHLQFKFDLYQKIPWNLIN